ncbi:MAG TPA: hypothetical protein VL424_13560 [Pararobbsia sp.]|nr:hypothetical protein [Pararobbsia sp.]
MRTWGNAIVGIAVSISLAACHGDNATTGSTSTGTPAGTATDAAGKTYYGTASFGDTVKIQLDTPGAGQLTMTFPNSQYGLNGAYVEPYNWTSATGSTSTAATLHDAVTSGSAGAAPAAAGAAGTAAAGISAGSLAAVSAGAVAAAAVAAAVASSSQTSGTSTSTSTSTSAPPSATTPTTLVGTVDVVSPTGTVLTGSLIASNQFSLPGASVSAELASLPGTYAFVQATSNVVNGQPVSSNSSMSGQLAIAADGTLTVCPYGNFSSTCAGAVTGSLKASADQTTVPGALDFTVNGQLLGHALVLTQANGTHTLLVDQTVSDAGVSGVTGGWVIAPAVSVGFDQLDGNWACTEQSFGGAPATSFAATFSESEFPISSVQAGITTDNVTLIPSTDTTGNTQPQTASATGLVAAEAQQMSLVNGTPTVTATYGQVYLPVSGTSLAFLDGLNLPGGVKPGVCTYQSALAVR